jgi:hypothetical protein
MNRRGVISATCVGLVGLIGLSQFAQAKAPAPPPPDDEDYSDAHDEPDEDCDDECADDDGGKVVYTSETVTRYVCAYGDTHFYGKDEPTGILQVTGRYYRMDGGMQHGDEGFESVQAHGGWRTYPSLSVYENRALAEVEYRRMADYFISQYSDRIEVLRMGVASA